MTDNQMTENQMTDREMYQNGLDIANAEITGLTRLLVDAKRNRDRCLENLKNV